MYPTQFYYTMLRGNHYQSSKVSTDDRPTQGASLSSYIDGSVDSIEHVSSGQKMCTKYFYESSVPNIQRTFRLCLKFFPLRRVSQLPVLRSAEVVVRVDRFSHVFSGCSRASSNSSLLSADNSTDVKPCDCRPAFNFFNVCKTLCARWGYAGKFWGRGHSFYAYKLHHRVDTIRKMSVECAFLRNPYRACRMFPVEDLGRPMVQRKVPGKHNGGKRTARLAGMRVWQTKYCARACVDCQHWCWSTFWSLFYQRGENKRQLLKLRCHWHTSSCLEDRR